MSERSKQPQMSNEPQPQVNPPYHQERFIQDIARVINQHSVDAFTETPDFVLARFVAQCIGAYSTTEFTAKALRGDKPADWRTALKAGEDAIKIEGMPEQCGPSRTLEIDEQAFLNRDKTDRDAERTF